MVMLTGRGDITYGLRLPNRVVDALCVAMRELPDCTPPELQPVAFDLRAHLGPTQLKRRTYPAEEEAPQVRRQAYHRAYRHFEMTGDSL